MLYIYRIFHNFDRLMKVQESSGLNCSAYWGHKVRVLYTEFLRYTFNNLEFLLLIVFCYTGNFLWLFLSLSLTANVTFRSTILAVIFTFILVLHYCHYFIISYCSIVTAFLKILLPCFPKIVSLIDLLTMWDLCDNLLEF